MVHLPFVAHLRSLVAIAPLSAATLFAASCDRTPATKQASLPPSPPTARQTIPTPAQVSPTAPTPLAGTPDADPMAGPKFTNTDDGRRPTINAFCPVMPKKSMADKTPAEFRRTWRGVEIGFCCEDCVMAWEGFTEDVREKRLGKVLRKDAQVPSAMSDPANNDPMNSR